MSIDYVTSDGWMWRWALLTMNSWMRDRA